MTKQEIQILITTITNKKTAEVSESLQYIYQKELRILYHRIETLEEALRKSGINVPDGSRSEFTDKDIPIFPGLGDA